MNRERVYKQFRAPTGDGEQLAVPHRSEWPALVSNNREARHRLDLDLEGRSLRELAAAARRSVLDAAVRFSRYYTDDLPAVDPDAPLVVTGHQPELFHPGVWLKNFAAAELAGSMGGVALNVVIDSDLCRDASVRVPLLEGGEASTTRVPLDAPLPPMPYEERPVADPAVLQSFGRRVTEAIGPLVKKPMIGGCWSKAVERCVASGRLSHGLAEARHLQESAWGARLVQIPQSQLCSSEAFAWFVALLLSGADRLLPIYNRCLADYRRAHRLRGKSHPMPDLAEDEGWTETPLWVWSADAPVRRGLWVRHSGEELLLSDRTQQVATLPAGTDGDRTPLANAIAELGAQGVKIRTRALVTTAFLRLFLADLFVHGIGGAKYDQVTDAVCEQFLGVQLPPHATLSGTLRLPVEYDAGATGRVAEAKRLLRELRFQPDRHVDFDALAPSEASDARRLVQEKRQLVNSPQTPANAAQRHRAIEEINWRLGEVVAPVRHQVSRNLLEAERNLHNANVLGSREYSFCLFPEDRLRDFLCKTF